MTYSNLIIYSVIGLTSITLIDTVGAIASRKMNFKYSYLSILSFLTYTIIAYLISKQYDLTTTLLVNGILGLYDGTIGFWVSIILKANNGQTIERLNEMLGIKSAMTMIMVSVIFGCIGYGISKF